MQALQKMNPLIERLPIIGTKIKQKRITELMQKVERALEQRNSATVFATCEEILKIDPKNADALAKRARCHRRESHYETAVADYTAALALKPGNTDILTRRGLCYREMQKYDEAIADFSTILVKDPNDSYALTVRGQAYQDKKDYRSAIEDYTDALELQEDRDVRQDRALCYYNEKEYDAALEDISEILKEIPENVDALLLGSIAYAKKKQFQESLDEGQKALDVAIRKTAWAHLNIGYTHLKKGDLTKAHDSLAQALALNPKDDYAHHYLAKCFVKLGKNDAALQSCQKALALDPKFSKAQKLQQKLSEPK